MSGSTEIPFGQQITPYFDAIFQPLVNLLDAVLFYPIPLPFAPDGFPFLVLWLVFGGAFFSARLGFTHILLIPHAVKVVAGRYQEPSAKGEITHFQALSAALSGTTGLGNIAGVAVAISIGGPGATPWMILAAFFGTATKLAEVTIGHKYRHIDPKTGKVSGGAWHYLRHAFDDLNLPVTGKILAVTFCIFCIGGSVGGGNMLQSNQTVAILVDNYPWLESYKWMIALSLAVLVGVVLIGGIKRIAHVAEKIVPAMALIYIIACCVVLCSNASLVPEAFAYMWQQAFTLEAAGGGMVGAMIMGFRRAFFSNEAGVGSAPIAHAAVKTNEPVREGCVAMLEPIVDTIFVCTMTGLVITITGVYLDESNGIGVTLTSAAFATVLPWFPQLLAACVLLFAFSTMITWSYYGERAWCYLFGERSVTFYYLFFCTLTFFGGLTDLGAVVDFGDLVLLAMALPNLIGLYVLHHEIAKDVKDYRKRFIGKTSS